MPNGYIIAEDTYLGEFRSTTSFRSCSDWSSRAYFCCQCGEVWARRISLNEDGSPCPFLALYATCRKHRDVWSVPGALTTVDFTPEHNEFSPEFIQREFEILINHYESKQ